MEDILVSKEGVTKLLEGLNTSKDLGLDELVMKGVFNLSKAITCLNLLLVRTGTRCRSRRIIDK